MSSHLIQFAERRRCIGFGCPAAGRDQKMEQGHGGQTGVLQQLAEGEFEIVHGSCSVVSGPLSVAFIPRSAFRAPHSVHTFDVRSIHNAVLPSD